MCVCVCLFVVAVFLGSFFSFFFFVVGPFLSNFFFGVVDSTSQRGCRLGTWKTKKKRNTHRPTRAEISVFIQLSGDASSITEGKIVEGKRQRRRRIPQGSTVTLG